MTDFPGWPEPHVVETNGISMSVHEAGPADAVPPIVLCHGFPELAFSWRNQVRDLAAQGFRVLAPDQRGYGRTIGPAAVEAYDVETLAADLIGLLDAKGIARAVFCGHDWGGIVIWQLGLRHPDRVAGLIGVNTPFIPRPPADPIEIMRRRMGEEMYIVHFQKPGEADAILAADVRKTLNFFFRRPPPGELRSAGLNSARVGEASVFPLVRMLEAYDPAIDPRDPVLSPEEFEFFAKTFERTGFTGGINWYRNFTRNWRNAAGLEQRIDAPALMIMAEKDAVLPPSSTEGMEAYVPHLDRHLILDSGHWTQQEKPAETTAAIAAWMRKTFP